MRGHGHLNLYLTSSQNEHLILSAPFSGVFGRLKMIIRPLLDIRNLRGKAGRSLRSHILQRRKLRPKEVSCDLPKVTGHKL